MATFRCKRSLVKVMNTTQIPQRSKSVSAYCSDNVRKCDYENFLATLLLPSEARDSAFAIRAFNIELAQVKEVTREELTAQMRFEFWKETLDQIYANKFPNHPVAKALYKAKEKHNLSKKWLRNLIDSRQDNLVDKSFSTIAVLEAYAEKSNSSLYYLIMQSLGVQNIQVDHASSHLGKSEGIMKLIRGIPRQSSRRVVLIPTTLLASHSVSQEDIIRGKREQKVKDVIYDLASVAYQHLDQAKQLEQELPKHARIAMLPAVNISVYLRKLQLADFDIFDPKLQLRSNTLPVRLYWSKIRNTYK